jgi:ABC-type bacteriocin/lantibiotic exporter with double-glycine peptidase domain
MNDIKRFQKYFKSRSIIKKIFIVSLILGVTVFLMVFFVKGLTDALVAGRAADGDKSKRGLPAVAVEKMREN